jgi:hypothetical protein
VTGKTKRLDAEYFYKLCKITGYSAAYILYDKSPKKSDDFVRDNQHEDLSEDELTLVTRFRKMSKYQKKRFISESRYRRMISHTGEKQRRIDIQREMSADEIRDSWVSDVTVGELIQVLRENK